MFLFLTNTHTHTHTQTPMGTYNKHQMHLSVLNWRIMDYETKISNGIPYIPSASDNITNISLRCELDLTMFVRVLEVSPQFRHNTVHIVTALIVLI